jgi:S1-C subfamily serine protease
VATGGPAARGGHKAGDLITAVDGQAVDDPNAFEYRFTTKPLGGQAQLGIVRAGKEQAVTIALQTAPEAPRDEVVIRTRSPFLGATVANLSPALAEELRLETSVEGVVIIDVASSTTAQSVFRRGDVVFLVNNEKIATTRDLERITKEPSRFWRITLMRGSKQISVVVGG